MVDASKQIYPPKEKLQNFFGTLYLLDEKKLCDPLCLLCGTLCYNQPQTFSSNENIHNLNLLVNI